MSKFISIAALGAAFSARYPVSPAGTVHLQAGESVELQAAAFRPFSSVGKTVHVKAVEHFFVAGEVVTKGDIVEVPDADAKHLIRIEKAVVATDAEVAEAQAPAKKGK